MKVAACNNISFTSLSNPITPFKIKTEHGTLIVKEEFKSFLQNSYNRKIIGKFFTDNFMEVSKFPQLKPFRCIANSDIYERYFSGYGDSCFDAYRRNPFLSTLLIAINKKHRIVGAILTHPFDEISSIKDSRTFYINSIAVDKKYRGIGLGKILLESTIKADGKSFTDIFLTAIKESVPFYKKLGFEEINPSNIKYKMFLKKIAVSRADYPKYMTPMTKNIKPSASRWIDRINRCYG